MQKYIHIKYNFFKNVIALKFSVYSTVSSDVDFPIKRLSTQIASIWSDTRMSALVSQHI